MSEKKIIQPFIKHDNNASQDGKILKMCNEFRKLSKTMDRSELESFVSIGAYGAFWRILEFLKSNTLSVNDIDVLADNIRLDEKFIKMIFDNFGLFTVIDGNYVSERLLRDNKRQEEKGAKASESASTRWVMSIFKKSYEEIFDKTPVIDSEEIDKLKSYNNTIPEFKKVLPDIVYTLKFIKFDDKINMKPLCNWLLTGNNLARVYNGEFGKLRHKKTPSEIAQEKKKAEEEKLKEQAEEINIESFRTKERAIEYIVSHTKDIKFLTPIDGQLIDRYNITNKELKQAIKELNK